jgi:hypothetical protein
MVRDQLVELAVEAQHGAFLPAHRTLVVVVWCSHGKHRSVAFAEVLQQWAREQVAHFEEVEVVHCEQPRWDRECRRRWGLYSDYSLPLEWVLGTHFELNTGLSSHAKSFIRVERSGRLRRFGAVGAALAGNFFSKAIGAVKWSENVRAPPQPRPVTRGGDPTDASRRDAVRPRR